MSLVQLAIGYERAGDLPRAWERATRALAADPMSPVALQEPGRQPLPGGRQPARSPLPAPLQRVRSPGPVDHLRPRLRRLTSDIGPAQKHFPGGLGDGGTRGTARSGQKWAARDGGPRAQGQGAGEGRWSSIRLGHAALSPEVAAEYPRDYIRDLHAGVARSWSSTTLKRRMF